MLLDNDKELNGHPDDWMTCRPLICLSSRAQSFVLGSWIQGSRSWILKRHFPCSLDVWLKPITIHHFQALSDLLAAIAEWYMSALFQPKFLLEVLKDTVEIHHMSLRRPITGGRQPDIEGKNEAQAPVLSPKILGESRQDCGQQPFFSWAPSSHLWG